MTYLFGTDKVIMWRKRLFPEGNANYEAEQEKRCIFPLSPDAHRFYDRHLFALRPIQHPDPNNSRETVFQVDWELAFDPKTLKYRDGREEGDRLVNYRGDITDNRVPLLNTGLR
jgi:hypothetical protein